MSTRTEQRGNAEQSVDQCAVQATVGMETEDSYDRLESSVNALVSLRETEKPDEEENPVEQDANWLEKLPGAVIGQDPKRLSNRERALIVWEEPKNGESVEGVEGRDWVYNYLRLLDSGDYAKLVPAGRKKVTEPGSRESFRELLTERDAITPGRKLVRCGSALIVRFPDPAPGFRQAGTPKT